MANEKKHWFTLLDASKPKHTELKEKYDSWKAMPDTDDKWKNWPNRKPENNVKPAFWQWLANDHNELFNNDDIKLLFIAKKERDDYLKSKIKAAHQFARPNENDLEYRAKLAKKGVIIPPIGKAIGLTEPFWLEALDPKHRKNDELRAYFKQWEENTGERRDFWTWLEEDHPEFGSAKSVQYFTDDQRKKYEVVIRNGKLYRSDSTLDKPIDTTSCKGKEPGKMAFAMNADGTLFAGEHVIGDVHHSSFLAGQRIIASGMIKIENGKITEINNHSGHYRPSPEHLYNAINHLSRDTFADNCVINIRDNKVRFHIIERLAKFLIKSSNNILIKIGLELRNRNSHDKTISLKDYYSSHDDRGLEITVQGAFAKDSSQDDTDDKQIATHVATPQTLLRARDQSHLSQGDAPISTDAGKSSNPENQDVNSTKKPG